MSGFLAVIITILLPGVDIFSGTNPVDPMALVAGVLFLLAWGILPLLWFVRGSIIEPFTKIKNRIF